MCNSGVGESPAGAQPLSSGEVVCTIHRDCQLLFARKHKI